MNKHSKAEVIDYIWQYSHYYGNQIAFLGHVEENGCASLIYLFNLLENVLKAHIDDYGKTSFQDVVRESYKSGLLTKVEHDFLNNKKSGIRKLRNILAHANLSKFNIRFGNEKLLYPLTENENCQLLYQKLSDIIFNIMLKIAALNLNVNVSVNVDNEIKALKISIVEFSPEDILIDKGIDPTTLDRCGWKDLKVSEQYRLAENASNVKLLSHIFKHLK